jgi:hypothetical protein
VYWRDLLLCIWALIIVYINEIFCVTVLTSCVLLVFVVCFGNCNVYL